MGANNRTMWYPPSSLLPSRDQFFGVEQTARYLSNQSFSCPLVTELIDVFKYGLYFLSSAKANSNGQNTRKAYY